VGSLSQSRLLGPLPCEDNELSRSPGRPFLLSIPDLIRDPEGRESIQSASQRRNQVICGLAFKMTDMTVLKIPIKI
jgi:hypothetical protein